jgi:hypothetical protein
MVCGVSPNVIGDCVVTAGDPVIRGSRTRRGIRQASDRCQALT